MSEHIPILIGFIVGFVVTAIFIVLSMRRASRRARYAQDAESRAISEKLKEWRARRG